MTASLNNNVNPPFATGVDSFVNPSFISATRVPTSQDVYNPGTRWMYDAGSSRVIYETTGGGDWDLGGVNLATTTTPGIVQLSTYAQLAAGTVNGSVPLSSDVYTYVNSVAVAGAPVATTAVSGIGRLVSDANAVARIASTGAQAYFVQPSNLTAVMSAPGPIGDTTPDTGAFSTLAFTTATGTAGGTWASGGTTIGIGADASNDAVNIGTAGTRVVTLGSQTATSSLVIDAGTGGITVGATGAKTIGIGNATGATAVNITSGTGSITLASTGAGDVIVNSSDTVLIDSAGVLELNSSAGVIGIGNDAVSQDINIGTAGTRLVTIGNLTASSSVSLKVGTNGLIIDGVASSPYTIGASTTTGAITIGGTAQTQTITLGSSSGTSTVAIQAGAGASTTTIGSGTAGANVTSINNGATAANSTVNILSGANTAGTHAVNIFTGVASGGTQTFNLFTSTNAGAINIGTGGTGVKTIAIGGSAANVITIGNTQTTGSVAIGNALTSGTVTVGGTAGTGAITIGQATNATGQTVNVNSGASIAGPNVVNVLAGATPAANQTFNVMTGVGSAGTYAFNVLTGASTGTTQTVSIATGAAATTVVIGNATAATALTLRAGTGNVLIDGAVTTAYTLGTATGTGAIALGLSTAGQTVSINNAASNTVANVVNILSGATPGANTTLNIMGGAGSAGTQTFNLLASGATRAGAVNIATGIAAHAVTIGQVTTTVAINGPTTHTLASGAATALTVTTAAGSGTAVSATSSAVTVPDFLSNVGGIKVTPTDVAAGASPQVANNRFFKVVFNTISIAAGADQALTITNSTITGASTDIMITWSGTTTGSAVSLKSAVPAAGSVTLTFTNGAGSTTTTSNITVIGWVLN